MISSISGIVKSISLNSVVVEVAGVGILIQVPNRIAVSLSPGNSASFHTHLVVREDALILFGFTDLIDRDFFELLLSVTGIGPKVAQAILSGSDSATIASAISSGNLKTLESFPGLGKKGAQRLVLELKDKVAGFASKSGGKSLSVGNQVENALQGLGYSAKDAANMVSQVLRSNEKESLSSSEILKLALKNSGKD
ncbi:MAG: Holliday junction branch migration protein RuvA [Candidatus Nanopelagicus sp.]